MSTNYYLWSFILFFLSCRCSLSTMTINEAPAKVILKFQVSKVNQALANESWLKICVEKLGERCYWKWSNEIALDGDQYKEIIQTFYINNMAINLTLDITIENSTKKIDFPRKSFNLKNFSSKYSFEMHPFNLESFITVTIEHECEVGYFPAGQCTKMCFPMPNESDCDSFGNKICKHDLQFNARMDRCLANNCRKSNINCENGRCINKASSFECICHESYVGKFCQFRNPCYPNPCANGGRCISDLNSQTFTCSCDQTQVIDSRCRTKTTEKCQCFDSKMCRYDRNGAFESCNSEMEPNNKKEVVPISPIDSMNNNNLKVGGLESKKHYEWNQVSMTTTLVAAIGCLILFLCVCVSLYVFYHTRDHQYINRDINNTKLSLPQYGDHTTNFNGPTFQRSLSLEDNSAYIPSSFQLLQTLPNTMTIGSSNGYSLNTNSYQDNPHSNMIIQGAFIGQREYPITPLMFHPNYPNGSSASTTSNGSFSMPPVLPPRSNETELMSISSPPKEQ